MVTMPQYDILTSYRSLNLFMGGYGSGKTKVIGDLSHYFVSNFPEVRGLIAANTYGQLTRSTLFRVREVWKDNGLTEYKENNKKGRYVIGKQPPLHFKSEHHNFDSYTNIISFINGAIIFVGSLDNYEVLDGMEVGWAMLDETKDTKPEAVDVITGRLRQLGLWLKTKSLYEQSKKAGDYSWFTGEPTGLDINPLYIFTAPARTEWLNEMFDLNSYRDAITNRCMSKNTYYSAFHGEDKRVIIASTYTNKENLPANYIPNMLNRYSTYLKTMYVFGSPFAKVGGEFYPYWSYDKHVKDIGYREDLPLRVSFDENVVPYMPSGIWQAEGLHAWKIDEIDLEEPRNNIHAVCDEIIKKYKKHSAGMFIYGDATSKKRDAKLKRERSDIVNFYSIIKNNLKQFKPRIAVKNANPPVITRADFINSVHEKNIFDIELSWSTKCKNSIADYMFLKKAADGTKDKKVTRDPVTKQSYQKHGHDSDLDDYFIIEYFNKYYRDFLREDKSEAIITGDKFAPKKF